MWEYFQSWTSSYSCTTVRKDKNVQFKIIILTLFIESFFFTIKCIYCKVHVNAQEPTYVGKRQKGEQNTLEWISNKHIQNTVLILFSVPKNYLQSAKTNTHRGFTYM